MRIYRYPLLQPLYHMRREPGRYILFRAGDLADYQPLDADQVVVLGLSDGAHSLDDLTAEVSAILRISSRQGRRHLRALLRLYAAALFDGSARPRRHPLPLLEFAGSEVDRDMVIPACGGQLSAPLRLAIAICPFCDRLCQSCRLDTCVKDHAADLPLPVERLEDIFLEARALGCLTLVLAGDNPLLQPRIFDIARLAITCGLCCSLPGQVRFSDQHTAQLDAAGIRLLPPLLAAPDPSLQALAKCPLGPGRPGAAPLPPAHPRPIFQPRGGVSAHEHCCPASRECLFVAWQGKCYPCRQIAHLPGMEIGDLRHQSLLQVWQGPLLSRILARGIGRVQASPCRNCPHSASASRRPCSDSQHP